MPVAYFIFTSNCNAWLTWEINHRKETDLFDLAIVGPNGSRAGSVLSSTCYTAIEREVDVYYRSAGYD